MMKVYIMLKTDADMIDKNNIYIVGKQEDADALVNDGYYVTYEVVDVANTYDVENIYLQNIGIG